MLLQNNAEIVKRQFGLHLGEIAEGLPADLAILTTVRQPRSARQISWVISSSGWWMPSWIQPSAAGRS
jgi:cytosine/adenosine deaminase-related metal-dependent hydrolase